MSRGLSAGQRPGWAPRRVACVLTLLVSGCSDTPKEPPPPGFSVTDSAGVRVVVNSTPLWDEGEGWQATAEPVLTLGTVDFPLEQQFDRIGGVTRLSDGTVVVLDLGSNELRAFDPSERHLWSAGGTGEGPGEMHRYDDSWPVLLRLKGDTLQIQNGLDRIRFGGGGELVAHETADFARFRELGHYYLYYCPFELYFLQDEIVFCEVDELPRPVPEMWTRKQTIMRTKWSFDRLDTLGTFFQTAGTSEETQWGTMAPPSPLGPQGIFRLGGHPQTRLLYARNEAYRIEVWDIGTLALTMVVERRAPRRARTREEATFAVQWALPAPGTDRSGRDPADDRWAAVDSMSIAEGFLLDDLGFLWVRRAPSPSEGDEGLLREIGTPDGTEWVIPRSSGLHDVFRPDGVYLGTVQLPPDVGVREIGEDYVLGIVRDDLDIEYVYVYGLDRGRGPA